MTASANLHTCLYVCWSVEERGGVRVSVSVCAI